MPPRDLTTRVPVPPVRPEDLDPETRAVVEVLAQELSRVIGASDLRRAKSVEELTADVGGLLARVEELESARSEQAIRGDERRLLQEATDRRLAPIRDTLIKRAVDVVLVLLSGGVLAWIGNAFGLLGG